jgi:hypothetical protein
MLLIVTPTLRSLPDAGQLPSTSQKITFAPMKAIRLTQFFFTNHILIQVSNIILAQFTQISTSPS